ncbi:MAG: PaaI family thioesterase, partial [Quisquiliibacterium sp.]
MQFIRKNPFIDHLRVEQESVGNGTALLVLDLRPELMNSLGMAHGGVLMTMLDLCMTQATRSVDNPDGEDDIGVVTIE